MIESTCLFCTQPIKFFKCNPRVYCSMLCRDKSRALKSIKTVVCDGCSILFKRKGFLLRAEKRYCNTKCSGKANRSKRSLFSDENKLRHSEMAKQKGFGKWMKGRVGNKGTFKKGQFSKEKHPFWKGGITKINQIVRQSDEYSNWRISIFTRDNYRCQWCGQKGGRLQADHIMPFSTHIKYRFRLTNGRTLCKDCHKVRTARQLTVMWKNQFASSTYLQPKTK